VPPPATDVLDGAEPESIVAATHDAPGLLAVHGFTGSPSSMREIAHAAAAAGFHVELPRLPGHGTVVDDMLATRWDDWCAAVVAAHDALLARTPTVVVAGQSMGGSLALWLALQRPGVAALACVNPATRPQPPDVLEMVDELLVDGVTVVPGSGSDLADPAATDVAYPGTPVAPLLSFQRDGLAPMVDRYGELTVPLRLLTSRQDHVVDPGDSEHLAATYGGPVEHTWLERSFHVATRDLERDLVTREVVAFAGRVASAGDARATGGAPS
jgi:carboxylesterase